MKCIHCDRDSKYSERTGKKCAGCGHAFAFEPRDGDVLTDPAFKHAILAVSANGAMKWTLDNLYYEICRRKKGYVAPVALLVVLGVLFVIAAIVGAVVHMAGLIVAGIIAFILLGLAWTRMRPNSFVNVTRTDFRRMWERWCSVHGKPEGLIERRPKPAKRAAEADIADYSFDRAVICDREETVDLLLANNFHFENNCAILTLEGYPPGPFATVKAMLKRNPRLEVVVLHDATVKGCLLARKLRTDPGWFGETVRVVDVVLRPGHAKPFQGLFLEAKDNYFPEGEGLTGEEAEWLSKYRLELAAIRPEQVLKRLYVAINRKPPAKTEAADDGGFIFIMTGNGGVYEDRVAFSADASDSGGDGDGFG